MKKIILLITFIIIQIILAPLSALAQGEDYALWRRPTYEKKLYEVGNRILAANNINRKISFKYTTKKEVNAYADGFNGTIYVLRGLLNYIQSDDELAAVTAHEIAHVINNDYQKTVISKLVLLGLDIAVGNKEPTVWSTTHYGAGRFSQSIESKADVTGVDLMVKADYNPNAMALILDKITSDGLAGYMGFGSHPNGSVRINNVNNYIACKHQQFVQGYVMPGLVNSQSPQLQMNPAQSMYLIPVNYNRMLMPAK